MNIDWNNIWDRHRRNYNKIKKQNKLTSPVDCYETYILKLTKGDLDEVDSIINGCTVEGLEKFSLNMGFIGERLPSDSIRLILVSENGSFELVSFFSDNEHLYYYSDIGESSIDPIEMTSLMGSAYTRSCVALSNTLRDVESNKIYSCKRNMDYSSKRNGRFIPNEVVFFSREKISVTIGGQSFNKIDWKHSWSVIGHWRNVKTLGKNRIGKYCEIGRTWIRPSIKGTGKFISKPRVCIGG
jgi:hypothetical protein